MSDPTGSGGASLLEGLAGGFVGGYGFRQGIAERKRRAKLQSDLALLKQMEEQRKAAHEAAEEARAGAVEQRAATTFAQHQQDLERLARLKTLIGQLLDPRTTPVDVPTTGVLSGAGPQQGLVPPELEETRLMGQILGGRTQQEQLVIGSHPELAKAARGSAGPLQRLVDPVTGQVYGWNPATNELMPTTMAAPGGPAPSATGTPPSQPPAPRAAVPSQGKAPARLSVKPPPVKIAYDAQGNAYSVTAGTGGAPPSTTPIQGMGKPITAPERKAAADANVALADHQHLTELENNPQTLQEVAQFMSVPAIGKLVPWGLAGGVSELIRKARTAGLSPAAQDYLKSLFDYASIVGPSRYGRNFRNEVLLEQLWSDFGAGQFGITPQGIHATRMNRLRGAHVLAAQGGPRAAAQVVKEFPPDTTAPPVAEPTIDPLFDPRVKR